MNRYFHPVTGKFVGWAWSNGNRCGDREVHEPHIHDSKYYIYGPYFCDGNVKSYEPKHRKEN